jgi:hypothetical protein
MVGAKVFTNRFIIQLFCLLMFFAMTPAVFGVGATCVLEDMETRFGVEQFHNTYSFTNPTYAVTYTTQQEADQRSVGEMLKTAIQSAISNGDPSYTATPDVYRLVYCGTCKNNQERAPN